MPYEITYVDVFSVRPLRGNPVAVVHDADSLDDERIGDLAPWTNPSETTFLLKPTVAEADYRARIFTPVAELPFAGHFTLGSCVAWLRRFGGGRSAEMTQQFEAGLVKVRVDGRRSNCIVGEATF